MYYCYMWWLMSIPTLRSGISTTTWPFTSHSRTIHTLHKHRQLSYEMPPPRQVVYIIHGYRLKVSKVMHSKQPLSYSLPLLLYRQAVQLFAVCSNFSVYLEMCCLSVRLPRRLNHITMYTIECSIILFIGTMLMLHRKLINMATPSWSISTQMLIKWSVVFFSTL